MCFDNFCQHGMSLIQLAIKAIKGQVMFNGDRMDNKVKNIIAGSLIDMEDLRRMSNQLLVVSVRRFDDALRRIRQFSEQHGLDYTPLSGIIITGKGSLKKDQEDYARIFHLAKV